MDWIKQDDIGWIDVLRIVAIFAVVVSHSSDFYIAAFDNDRVSFYTGVFTESFVRPCVVLMVLISGYLLLPIRGQYSVGGYWRKRIGRVAWPLVFWSVVLPVVFYLYFHYFGQDTRNPGIDAATYTLGTLGTRISTFLLNFNYDTTPLWYLYMLIGLYLALPIVNGWLTQASRRDIEMVLLCWLGTLFIPYLRILGPMVGAGGEVGFGPLWGECTWNVFHSLYYMAGFMGYMLLAYYLKQWPPQWSWRKTLGICIPMYLLGFLGTSLGYIFVDQLAPGEYQYLEIPWWMCGLNVFLQAMGVFLIFMRLRIRPRQWLSRAAAMMFGVYLCHFPLVHMAYDWLDTESLPPFVRLISGAVITFVLSYAIVRAMWRFKFTRRMVK